MFEKICHRCGKQYSGFFVGTICIDCFNKVQGIDPEEQRKRDNAEAHKRNREKQEEAYEHFKNVADEEKRKAYEGTYTTSNETEPGFDSSFFEELLNRIRARQEQQYREQQRKAFYEQQNNSYQRFGEHGPGSSKHNPDLKQETKSEEGPSAIRVVIHKKKLNKLLMLCHPDKHNNSELSLEITKWLVDLNNQLLGKPTIVKGKRV